MAVCFVCEATNVPAVCCPTCGQWLCLECWGSIVNNRECGICQVNKEEVTA